MEQSVHEMKVVVAMSGGVDSSVAALLLARQGIEAIGVSMQVWDYRSHGGCASKATCCAPDDFTDARKVAHSVGIPYYVVDFERSFRAKVIDEFVRSYHAGKTPNPCIDCNNKVKFRELRERAALFGCTHVATGHYAQVEERSDGFHLLRGVDQAKDQSYFLYNLSQRDLAETLFPVGAMTKQEVREIAAETGLSTAQKPESQDICFITGSMSDFLVKIGGARPGGDIVTADGRIVGRHQGIHQFTVGQRRGLGVGGTQEPLYVIEIDAEQNRVVVGQRTELARERFFVEELSWVHPAFSVQSASGQVPHSFKARVQVRHRHEGVPVLVNPLSLNEVEVQFEGEWTPIAPGQAAVFYSVDNSEVLAGGRIRAEKGIG
jgi:tRNA-uridine 2-sulfurtransferase